ncbi:MAG: site-specific DNA-methyltransferase [Deltaproteobacteria bacterium]|nr:site-specific DNA-methyltransferase [Deltaproteobacteria bacterium]
MATGNPSRRSPIVKEGRVELHYDGKKTVSDILKTTPSRLTTLWSSSSEMVNSLIWSENLAALAALTTQPKIKGKVRLVYIDPPFATQSAFQTRDQRDAYEDVLGGASFVEFLRERLVLLRDLLADDGSLYLHLDDKMVFAAKLVLDEVFGQDGFRNCIVRKKCNPKNFTRRAFGNIADYILFYSKTGDYVWNRQYDPWDEDRAREYQYVDEVTGRRFMKVPVHAPGVRNGETGTEWRGRLPPPGKHWQYPPRVLDEMDAKGEIFWSANGNPRRKVFLDESKGVGVQDIWLDFRDAHNQNIEITGYPTEKNVSLLSRIVAASSNEGDLVLDCFCGSGTSLVAADMLGRRWIGIDASRVAIETCLRRFALGSDLMGDYVGAKTMREARPTRSIEEFSMILSEEKSEAGGSLVESWAELKEKKAARMIELVPEKAVEQQAVLGRRSKQRNGTKGQIQLPGLFALEHD